MVVVVVVFKGSDVVVRLDDVRLDDVRLDDVILDDVRFDAGVVIFEFVVLDSVELIFP